MDWVLFLSFWDALPDSKINLILKATEHNGIYFLKESWAVMFVNSIERYPVPVQINSKMLKDLMQTSI